MTQKYFRIGYLILFSLGIGLFSQQTSLAQQDETNTDSEEAITNLLIKIRIAAEKADSDKYFSCLAENGIFFGTDPGERYTRDQLKAVLDPYFKKGIGWKHEIKQRHVYVGPNDKIGWFEEQSERDKVGTMRTTGVVMRKANDWVIVQYNVSILVPNEAVEDLVKLVDKIKLQKQAAKKPDKD